ncbi:MAG: cytochrome c [Burkholderiaceae bacterium]
MFTNETSRRRGRWLAALAVATLAACGGGGTTTAASSANGATKVATFIDAAVQGLQFESPGSSGVTDARGNFTYKSGESVTFRVGNVVLGSTTPGGDVVRPRDLVADAGGDDDARVIRILRMLQSLDDNANPEDGIRISEGARDYLSRRSSTELRLDDSRTSDSDVAERLPTGEFTVGEREARDHAQRHAGDESNAGLGYSGSGGSATQVAQPASSAGRLLASNCFQCHGTGGMGGFERIRGGEADEVSEFLGKPASESIMAAHAQGFTRAQLDAVVAYLNQ